MTQFEKNYMPRLAADAPKPFKDWFNLTDPIAKFQRRGRAAYVPEAHAIRMPIKPKDAAGVVTWAHEVGHAVDFNGKARGLARSNRGLGNAIRKDADAMLGINATIPGGNPVTARKFALLDASWDEAEAAFDHKAATSKFVSKWPKAAAAELDLLKISDKAKLDFAAKWEAGNWEDAIKAMRQPITVAKLDLKFKRVPGTRADIRRLETFEDMMGKISDAIEAASILKRGGHANGLAGHGKKYMFSRGLDPGGSGVPSAAVTEYFANAFAAHTVEGWPLYSHLLEMATPHSTAAFRKIAEGSL